MDDSQWVAAAAGILTARTAQDARRALAGALLEATGADVAMRFAVDHRGDTLALSLRPYGRRRLAPRQTWQRDALCGDHPFVEHYRRHGELMPVTLTDLVRGGYEMGRLARHRLTLLGAPAELLCLPLDGTPETLRGWFFAVPRSVPRRQLDRLADLRSLVAGLDAHAVGSDSLVTADPCTPHRLPQVRLTETESAVLDLVAAGLTAAAIARRLGVSPRTVHKHQEHLYRKIGTHDRLSTVLAAQRLGLLPR